jgi:hypothetical protein
MRFDEGAEPGLLQDVRQAGVAVQFVVDLDRALTLQCQALSHTREKIRAKIPTCYEKDTLRKKLLQGVAHICRKRPAHFS